MSQGQARAKQPEVGQIAYRACTRAALRVYYLIGHTAYALHRFCGDPAGFFGILGYFVR
jgi:hypothetical protein